MSVTTLKSTSIPNFQNVCSTTTLSKILKILAHSRTSYATAYVICGDAWVVIRNSQVGDKFYIISQNEWESVCHIIFTDPLTCRCRLCDWRIKRNKYPICEFKHLTACPL